MYMFPRLIMACIAAICMATTAAQTIPQATNREVRAVWLTTIGGLDWPESYSRNAAGAERQKSQLRAHLDRLKAMGINTVLLQTRIRGTVIYPSAIEPWDGCLSGRPGTSPGYDALEFAVNECHRRGMSIQAWVVAFPLTSLGVTRQLGKQSTVSRHPELCVKAGDHWMMNPGIPATADYLATICREIVENYDVDGIHLDYIRYPEKEVTFNDSHTFRRYGKGKTRAEWRTENVTRCVRKIYLTIKAVKPWVSLSCSPVGKHDDLPRQHSYGWNARTTVSQDVQQWMQEGIMDEIFPMMYFRGQHFYPFALDWIESANGRTVVPGLGAYFLDPRQKDWPLETVTREMNFLRIHGAGGQGYFRSRFVEDNVKGIADYMQHTFYTRTALRPAMVWEDSICPTAPELKTLEKGKYTWNVEWEASHDPTPGDTLRYNVYESCEYPVDASDARLVATRLSATRCSIDVACPYSRGLYYAVTAIDRFGNESAPMPVNKPATAPKTKPTEKRCTDAKDGKLAIPRCDAKLLTICDDAGCELSVVHCDSTVDVSRLAEGFYKIYGQGRKGKPHLLCRFRVRP